MLNPLRSKPASQEESAQSSSTPAPIRGWNTRDPVAQMDPRFAVQLDNWFPGTGSVSLREGARNHVTAITGLVKSLFPWSGVSEQKLFAGTNASLQEVSAAGSPVATGVARTLGYGNFINFRTTGQSYLVIVNGQDDLVYYNGTVWTSVANFSISGGGSINTNLLANINSYKRSIYFIGKNSTSFYYLPIDQITGLVSEFPLGALFNKGGKLVAMGTWTMDGGFGQEDYSVFITSKGQAAVYLGTDPSSATTWSLKGVYNLAPPLGDKCFCNFGSDLLIMTTRGLFSLGQILQKGGFAGASALSDLISDPWVEAATLLPNALGWECIEYPDRSALICNIPQTENFSSVQFVMNTKTGAWCRFKGWDAFAFTLFNRNLYMGMDGKVALTFYPGNDFDTSITAIACTAFNYYSPKSRLKNWLSARPNLKIGGSVAVNVAIDTDFSHGNTWGAAVFNDSAVSRWDAAKFDENKWAAEPISRLDWVTVTGNASYCAAMRLRVIARDSTVAWSATDMLYKVGALLG